MPLYYVNIPCYISVDAPELARRPNKFCAIGVHADSPADALSKATEALQRAVDEHASLGDYNGDEAIEPSPHP